MSVTPQSLRQPSLPLSLADGLPRPYDETPPSRRSRPTNVDDSDDDLRPSCQKDLMDGLDDGESSRASLSRASQRSRSSSNNSDSSSRRATGESPSTIVPGDSVSNVGTAAESSLLKEILKEVQVSDKKVASLEKQLQELRESGETSTGGRKKKIAPSPEVRMMVRKLYKTLEDEDENFGWNFDLGICHADNQDILKKIVAEARTHLVDVSSATIKDAVKTYYNSMATTRRLKASGKYKDKVTKQRKKNRKSNKLKRRLSTLAKTKALTEEKKKKFEPAFTIDLISSEESDVEEEEDGSQSVAFLIRQLPWRSDMLTELFLSLDHKHCKKQSKKSTQMTLRRYKGEDSTRPVPHGVPTWCVKESYVKDLQ